MHTFSIVSTEVQCTLLLVPFFISHPSSLTALKFLSESRCLLRYAAYWPALILSDDNNVLMVSNNTVHNPFAGVFFKLPSPLALVNRWWYICGISGKVRYRSHSPYMASLTQGIAPSSSAVHLSSSIV